MLNKNPCGSATSLKRERRPKLSLRTRFRLIEKHAGRERFRATIFINKQLYKRRVVDNTHAPRTMSGLSVVVRDVSCTFTTDHRQRTTERSEQLCSVYRYATGVMIFLRTGETRCRNINEGGKPLRNETRAACSRLNTILARSTSHDASTDKPDIVGAVCSSRLTNQHFFVFSQSSRSIERR